MDTHLDQDPARCVEVEGLAANPAFQQAGAHGALLEEGGGEAAFAEGGEGAQRVVAHDDDGLGEVELCSSEDPGVGLPADLVLHIGRVGEGAYNGLAVAICPPAKDHTPAVE